MSFSLAFSIADQAFFAGKSMGIFNVSVQLLQTLEQRGEIHTLHVFANSSLTPHISPLSHVKIEYHDMALRHKLGRILWDQFLLARATKRVVCDWLLLPKGFAPRYYKVPCKLAVYVHDIMPIYYSERYPHYFSRLERAYFVEGLKSTLRHASVIFTNSDFTRREVERFARDMRIPCPPIVPVGIGFSQGSTPHLSSPKKRGILLHAASLPHKRSPMVFDFLSRWQRNSAYDDPIYVVGQSIPAKSTYEMRGWQWLGRLDSEVYQKLLTSVSVTIYSSEYEGFGMPPVESILAGACPVYSDIAATREVMEMRGCPFQNDDASSFSSALDASFSVSHEIMQQWGQELSRRFAWEDIGQNIVDVLLHH